MRTLTTPPSWPTQCFYAFARVGPGLAGECDETVSDDAFSCPRY